MAAALMDVLPNYVLMGPEDLVREVVASASSQGGRSLDIREQNREGLGRLFHSGSNNDGNSSL
jgi:hypothetical protein